MFDRDFLGQEDYVPYLKLDSRNGRCMIREGDEDVQLDDVTVEVDIQTMMSGWLHFEKGTGKSFVQGEDQPTPDHQRGVQIFVYNDDIGVREVMMTARTAIRNVINFWDAVREAGEPGNNPIVNIVFEPVKTKSGVVNPPKFNIVAWVSRSRQFAKLQNDDPDPDLPF